MSAPIQPTVAAAQAVDAVPGPAVQVRLVAAANELQRRQAAEFIERNIAPQDAARLPGRAMVIDRQA